MLAVTGPTGNVGSDLTTALVAAGNSTLFRIAAHHPDELRAAQGEGVDIVAFAYDDQSTWPSVLADASTLFLLFPLPHPRTARSWMVPFVQAAASAGVRHIIYVTVPGADRKKIVPHHAVETAIRESGANYTFLRCAYFSQNLVRALSTHGVDIVEHDEVYIPAKRSQTTFLDARDVADAVLAIVADPDTHYDRSYTLTGPEALTFEAVAATLSDVLSRPITYTSPSPFAFWRRLRKRGVSRDTVFFMQIVYHFARRGSNAPKSDDLESLLGRAPRTFADFARDNAWRWRERAWT